MNRRMFLYQSLTTSITAVHFIDLVHYITGATVPKRAVALGGTFRWKDARTAPDSIETILEYPDFLVRYNTTFGTSAGNYLKVFGTRGVLDASRWSWAEPFQVSSEGSGEPDRVEPGTRLPDLESTPHMKNWLECLRSRKVPNAPIEAGYAHSVAAIMADEAYVRGPDGLRPRSSGQCVKDDERRLWQIGLPLSE
jgi:predicted dehydrogenase